MRWSDRLVHGLRRVGLLAGSGRNADMAPLPPAKRGAIPDDLWNEVLADFPFLADRAGERIDRLRALSSAFLRSKEFFGAHGLEITDRMAVSIAAQACLPILHWGNNTAQALAWYGDFVGIVVHADEVVAHRETVDEAGVVHAYDEVLVGEAMDRGPVTLAWTAVAAAGATAQDGYNVVIHEFAHKIDLRNGDADGCPPLPAGFMGHTQARQAHQAWREVLDAAYLGFRDQVIVAERFGGPQPWLDAYGAESIGEFFAVACEAYFVHRSAFERDFLALAGMFDAFFEGSAAAASPTL